jgi:hypothetical protein
VKWVGNHEIPVCTISKKALRDTRSEGWNILFRTEREGWGTIIHAKKLSHKSVLKGHGFSRAAERPIKRGL